MSRIPTAVVDAVLDRCQGYCEACTGPLHGVRALHHRLPRSGGGRDEAVNLMVVHGDLARNCHNLTEYSIHQNPERSYRLGHLVKRGTSPASVAVIAAPDLISLRK